MTGIRFFAIFADRIAKQCTVSLSADAVVLRGKVTGYATVYWFKRPSERRAIVRLLDSHGINYGRREEV